MSENSKTFVDDEEIRKTLEECAGENDVPIEAVLELYEAQREVVNMKRRKNILQRTKSIIEEHAENYSQ